MAPSVRTIVDISILVLLCLMDIRDLWYKVIWLGSDDSYSFKTKTIFHLHHPQLLQPAMPLKRSGEFGLRASGWTSFLEKCDSMEAFSSGENDHFLHTFNTNCRVGGLTHSTSHLAPQLILTGSVRVDSMAWAACKLLYSYRRPPLCHDSLVTDFLHRYYLLPKQVSPAMMVTPMSNAETELRVLLEVISKSMPLSSIVCVEGFAYNSSMDSQFPARIFGCGSPNLFLSAFVGHHATAFADLHADKAALTIDYVNFLGMHFMVRQQAVSSFAVEKSGNDATTLTHTSALNLNCNGFLYYLMIIVDVVLIYFHILSAVEIGKLVISTSLRNKETVDTIETPESANQTTFFACSLYRSHPIVLLTLITQMISWMLILPNTIVWNSTKSMMGKIHAALTITRLWTMALIIFNSFWDLCVLLDEKRAYIFTKLTHISSMEIVAIVSTACFFLRSKIFAISDLKHQQDKQRLIDSTSFRNFIVFSNANGESQNTGLLDSNLVLWMIYKPLVWILLTSLLLQIGFIIARYSFNQYRNTRSKTVPTSTATNSITGSTEGSGYTRSPVEELLNIPIRAKNLVRSSSTALEQTSGKHVILQPTQYLEYGVMLEDSRYLRTRRGFFRVIPAHVPMNNQMMDDTVDNEPPGSPKKRRASQIR